MRQNSYHRYSEIKFNSIYFWLWLKYSGTESLGSSVSSELTASANEDVDYKKAHGSLVEL
jgi:hypothetical protein